MAYSGPIDPNNLLVGAIDQGTSSSRVLLFRVDDWRLMVMHQIEFKSQYPAEGWVEQDPMMILDTVKQSLRGAAEELLRRGGRLDQVKCIGITNQRETTVVWDKRTGRPLHNALVWLDNRTKEIVDQLVHEGKYTDDLKASCGLPLSTYFSATKLLWLLANAPTVKKAQEENTLMVGTVDTWLIWNLSGGNYVTDVTNASRTMLMNLKTLDWDQELCDYFDIDMAILPEIVSCSEPDRFGRMINTAFPNVPITGCIGNANFKEKSNSLFNFK